MIHGHLTVRIHDNDKRLFPGEHAILFASRHTRKFLRLSFLLRSQGHIFSSPRTYLKCEMIRLERACCLRHSWIGASYKHDYNTSFVPLHLVDHRRRRRRRRRCRFLTTSIKRQEIRLVSPVAVVNQISSCTVFSLALPLSC